MMNKLLLCLTAIMLVIVLVIAGCAAPGSSPQPTSEPIVLKAVAYDSPTAPRTQIAIGLINLINERANGELVIDLLGGPEVVPMFDQGLAVRDGTVDIAFSAGSFYSTLVTEAAIHMISELTAAEERESGFYDLQKEAHRNAGLVYLGKTNTSTMAQMAFMVTKPVNSLAELREQRLRLGDAGEGTPNYVAAFKDVGLDYYTMAFEEIYPGLERGIIDSWLTVWDLFVAMGTYEVAGYVINHPLYVVDSTFIMNPDSWDRIPEHLQKLIVDAKIDHEAEGASYSDQIVTEAQQALRDNGVEFISWSPSDAEELITTLYRGLALDLRDMSPEYGPKLLEALGGKY